MTRVVSADYRFVCQSDVVGYSSKSFTTTRVVGSSRVVLRLRNRRNYREPCTIIVHKIITTNLICSQHTPLSCLPRNARSDDFEKNLQNRKRSIRFQSPLQRQYGYRYTELLLQNRISAIVCRRRRRRTIIDYRPATNEWPTRGARLPRFIRSCAWTKYITRIRGHSSPRKPCSLYVDVIRFKSGIVDIGPN